MSKTDLGDALAALAPRTKVGRVRAVMPIIEAKIAEGVRIAEIVEALRAGGLELSEGTLKSYLRRHRIKANTQGASAAAPGPGAARTARARGTLPSPAAAKGKRPETAALPGPVSMLELDRIMNPDPVQQAEDMAFYERIGRQQRRKRKP